MGSETPRGLYHGPARGPGVSTTIEHDRDRTQPALLKKLLQDMNLATLEYPAMSRQSGPTAIERPEGHWHDS